MALGTTRESSGADPGPVFGRLERLIGDCLKTAARARRLRDAGADDEAVQPGVEAVRIAEPRQVAPGDHQRVLEGILGPIDIPEDPLRDREEAIAAVVKPCTDMYEIAVASTQLRSASRSTAKVAVTACGSVSGRERVLGVRAAAPSSGWRRGRRGATWRTSTRCSTSRIELRRGRSRSNMGSWTSELPPKVGELEPVLPRRAVN